MKVSPREAAKRLRNAAKNLDAAIARAEAETAREMLAAAQKLSSGPYSLVELARMGHPYARRKPNPPQDPAIINKQQGRFYRSWRIVGVVTKPDGSKVTRIENTAPYSIYLQDGTRKMIARPLPEAVIKAIDQKRRTARIAREISNLLK